MGKGCREKGLKSSEEWQCAELKKVFAVGKAPWEALHCHAGSPFFTPLSPIADSHWVLSPGLVSLQPS